MKKQFVTYKIALMLEDIGFNEECFCTYSPSEILHYEQFDDELLAPLWQQVIDWFREEHSIIIIINPYHDLDAVSEVDQILWDFTLWDKEWNDVSDYTYHHSYEEAREAAILEAIKLVKENKK